MDVLDLTAKKATLDITEAELLILNSALNEVCNGIELPEFETRIGSTLDDVTNFLEQINKVLNEIILLNKP